MQKFRQARVQPSALKNGCCAFTAGENFLASCPKPFFEMIFFLHDISTNPIAAKKAGKCKKVPQNCKISGGLEAITCFFASRYGCREWDFSLPARKHTRRSSQIRLPSPFSPLSRSFFPPPAAVALQAHSLLLRALLTRLCLACPSEI